MSIRKLDKSDKQSSRMRNIMRMSPDTPSQNILNKDIEQDSLRKRQQSDDEESQENCFLPAQN